jgi:hypothetical protein
MNAIVTKLKISFMNWREWEPNPILVKELRQAVRSRILTTVFLALLVLFFLVSLASLTRQSLLAGAELETGRNMFDGCLAVLTFGTLVFIPLYTGIRIALEQYWSDLILFTPMPAIKLIRGKIFSGMYLVSLFFSVCLPFMTLSHLLRGLDWFAIGFILLILFFTINLAILVAVAVALLPFPIFFKILSGIIYGGGLIALSSFLLLFFFSIVEAGAAPMPPDNEIFFGLFLMFLMAIFIAIGAYCIAVSLVVFRDIQLQPQSEVNPSND